MGTVSSTTGSRDQLDAGCLKACSERLETCGVTPVVESLRNLRGRRIAVVLGENSVYASCPVSIRTSKSGGGTEKLDSVELSSPLHELCKNNLHILKLLLRHLPKTNDLYLLNSEMYELLEDYRYGRVAEILASFENAVNLIDSNNQTPLDCLIRNICVKDVCMMPWLPALSMLLDSGAQMDVLDGDRSNICQILQLTAELLQGKTCTDGCMESFYHALHEHDPDFLQTESLGIAIRCKNPVLVKLLANNGVCVNASNCRQVVGQDQVGSAAESYGPIIYALKQYHDGEESPVVLEIIDILANKYAMDIKTVFFTAQHGYMKIYSRLMVHPNFDRADHKALEDLLQTSGLHRPLHLLRGVMESETKAFRKATPCKSAPLSRSTNKKKWRSKIEQSFHGLVADLEPDGEFLDWLVEKRVFGLDIVEDIRAKPTTREKARELLLRAQCISVDKQEHFCWALRQSNQEHLAELLEDENMAGGYAPVNAGYTNIKRMNTSGESETYYGYMYQTPLKHNHITYLRMGAPADDEDSIYDIPGVPAL